MQNRYFSALQCLQRRAFSCNRSLSLDRKFGIELEFLVPITSVGIRGCATLREYLIANTNANYTIQPKDYSAWMCKNDVTVMSGDGGYLGLELASPVLSYTDANHWKEINSIVSTLDDIGCFVNYTCGFHVHFCSAGLTLENIAAIAINYGYFERVIDSFLCENRRGIANKYCRSNQRLIDSTIGYPTINPHRIETLLKNGENAFMNKSKFIANYLQKGRHYKLNLAGVSNDGNRTIENRHHHGTLTNDEMMHWVLFNLEFAHASLNHNLWEYVGTERSDEELRDLLWEFLGNSDLQEFYTNKMIASNPILKREQEREALIFSSDSINEMSI